MGITGTEIQTNNMYSSYPAGKANSSQKSSEYGDTIGTPELSEEGKKYYEELKKKYSNMDFILVSEDMKEQAKQQAGSYANGIKTVALIDEDKIERMAVDKEYRKQYEGIISNAESGLSQLKQSMESSGANVKGYGIQVNDGGNTSFFAVLKKSSESQKKRIEKKAADTKEKKKLEKDKKTKEDSKKVNNKGDEDDEEITISASSIDDLMKKINDYIMGQKSDNIKTSQEKMVGQNVDYRS